MRVNVKLVSILTRALLVGWMQLYSKAMNCRSCSKFHSIVTTSCAHCSIVRLSEGYDSAAWQKKHSD